MKTKRHDRISRRKFLKSASTVAASAMAVSGFPFIVPAHVLDHRAPSNRITIGAIGNGRISRIHDLPGVWKFDQAQVVAVCDLDRKRAEDGKVLINEYYSRKNGKPYDGVSVYHDYRELIGNKDIDAVIISTPDHTHAMIALAAARAGKHIYMQKPASLTIAEGRLVSDVVRKSGVIFQIGSQQRSSPQFRYAAELIRNHRIGELKTVYVGLPGDPSGISNPKCRYPKT